MAVQTQAALPPKEIKYRVEKKRGKGEKRRGREATVIVADLIKRELLGGYRQEGMQGAKETSARGQVLGGVVDRVGMG